MDEANIALARCVRALLKAAIDATEVTPEYRASVHRALEDTSDPDAVAQLAVRELDLCDEYKALLDGRDTPDQLRYLALIVSRQVEILVMRDRISARIRPLVAGRARSDDPLRVRREDLTLMRDAARAELGMAPGDAVRVSATLLPLGELVLSSEHRGGWLPGAKERRIAAFETSVHEQLQQIRERDARPLMEQQLAAVEQELADLSKPEAT